MILHKEQTNQSGPPFTSPFKNQPQLSLSLSSEGREKIIFRTIKLVQFLFCSPEEEDGYDDDELATNKNCGSTGCSLSLSLPCFLELNFQTNIKCVFDAFHRTHRFFILYKKNILNTCCFPLPAHHHLTHTPTELPFPLKQTDHVSVCPSQYFFECSPNVHYSLTRWNAQLYTLLLP